MNERHIPEAKIDRDQEIIEGLTLNTPSTCDVVINGITFSPGVPLSVLLVSLAAQAKPKTTISQ